MNTSFFYNPVPLYRNAVEPLVIQEVDRQVDRLPAKLLKCIDVDQIKAQAIAYALNRLPAMYATSERGWEFQQHKAQEKYGQKNCGGRSARIGRHTTRSLDSRLAYFRTRELLRDFIA